ncbi:MAG: hypothetical protein RLZ61_2041 [Planctomycetota bacterium]|jgi:hypothetical protein|nr:hypothetical protein [bacterium]NBT60382.1 hypothetical protein [Planctomycetia bacterium]
MISKGNYWVLLCFFAGFVVLASGASVKSWINDDMPSFKKRNSEEKTFMADLGKAVIKAVHPTAQKIVMIKYEIVKVKDKENRSEINLKMEYFGVVSNKKYIGDAVIKVDTSSKEGWEALNIDYVDNNNLPLNRKNLQELIKSLNR